MDGLFNPVDLAAFNTQVASLAAAIPAPGVATPNMETVSGAPGQAGVYSPAGHTHPRLSSVNSGTLDGNGLSGNIIFTRAFTKQPGVVLTPIIPGGSQPVILQVQSWIMDASGNFTGCVVKGYRTTLLPSAIATLGALLSFNIAGGNASGVEFSCLAVQTA